eukprot:6195152-Pleurochrysis_carterae.AAC.2
MTARLPVKLAGACLNQQEHRFATILTPERECMSNNRAGVKPKMDLACKKPYSMSKRPLTVSWSGVKWKARVLPYDFAATLHSSYRTSNRVDAARTRAKVRSINSASSAKTGRRVADLSVSAARIPSVPSFIAIAEVRRLKWYPRGWP